MLENEYYKKDNFFIIIWLIAGFYTIFFIFYANNAWFYQDDFTFLYANIHKIDWSHLWTFENFGRFVTRDLYWYYLYSFFGSNSSMYFIFNLFLLVFNSILIFNLFRKLEIDKNTSFIFSIVYYISLPSLFNFYWISNSQHILAHTFILIFLIKVSNKFFYIRLSWKECILTGLILILGLYSNILALFGLSLVFFNIYIYRRDIIFSIQFIFFLLFSIIISFIFVFELKKYSIGVYSLSYTLTTFIQNLQFYLNPYEINVYGMLLVLVVSIIFNIIQKKIFNLRFLILGLSFYFPFSFAQAQHYHNYVHLTTVFIFAFIFITIQGFFNKKYNKYLFLFLILSIIFSSKAFINYMSNDPLGGKIEVICNTLKNNMEIQSEKTIYFKIDKEKEIPLFWWGLGFGEALKLFVNPDKIYMLTTENKDCIVEITNDMKIKNINCKEGKK